MKFEGVVIPPHVGENVYTFSTYVHENEVRSFLVVAPDKQDAARAANEFLEKEFPGSHIRVGVQDIYQA